MTADLKPALFEEFQARHIPGTYDLNCTIKTTAFACCLLPIGTFGGTFGGTIAATGEVLSN